MMASWHHQGRARFDWVSAVMIVALILASGIGGALLSTTTTNHNTTVCNEDMSCWDCHTMGNRMCGVVVFDNDAVWYDEYMRGAYMPTFTGYIDNEI